MNKKFEFKLPRVTFLFYFLIFFVYFSSSVRSGQSGQLAIDSLIGERVSASAKWTGTKNVSPSISILVLAGHADSQNMEGAGTSGEAVGLRGAVPMSPKMRDELFWNIQVRDAVVKLGRERGLNISSYDPVVRKILDENDPRTNWSVGYKHAQRGGYALEIHFDAYGKDGYGSGLIPPISQSLNTLDESLAKSFGRYPKLFRGGLGASKRQIRILEIGKLEGNLERSLRDPLSQKTTINSIAKKVVDAFWVGLYK